MNPADIPGYDESVDRVPQQTRVLRNCRWCGKVFRAKAANQRFCSQDCSQNNRRRLDRERDRKRRAKDKTVKDKTVEPAKKPWSNFSITIEPRVLPPLADLQETIDKQMAAFRASWPYKNKSHEIPPELKGCKDENKWLDWIFS